MPEPEQHEALGSLVDGQWLGTGDRVMVSDPSDGTVVGAVLAGDASTATAAADAAARAFDAWSRTTPRHRADLLHAGAEALRERREELALLLAREAGKRLPEAGAEIDFSIEYLRWFAEVARRPVGELHASEIGQRRHLSVRRPAGVALSLTPWNFPVSIQARKIAPMLAAGCTVVARVSEKAPLAATEMVRSLAAVLPRGVLNLVHGPARAVTGALLDHEAVRIVSFTGSTAVGKQVMAAAAERMVRPLLELGGNAPFLVFDDADLDAAVTGAVLGRTRNTGQSCVAANRFLVQRGVAREFSERLAAALDALTIGRTLPGQAGEPVADLGPMIDERAAAGVRDLVASSLARGGSLLTARAQEEVAAGYVAPALVAVEPGDPLTQVEVFGPAAGVVTFDDEEQGVALANASTSGLAAYAYTRDGGRAWRLIDRIEAGVVGINEALPSVAFAPMGGVKESGLGREGADIGMHEFQDVRHVAWRE